MLESVTLVSRGGVILYQYAASPSLVGAADPMVTRQGLNELLVKRIAAQQPHEQNTPAFTITNSISYVWMSSKATAASAADTDGESRLVQGDVDYIAIVSYPDILFQGPREYLRKWAESLLQATIRAYNQYYAKHCSSRRTLGGDENDEQARSTTNIGLFQRPDPEAFDKIFQFLLTESKTKSTNDGSTNANPAASTAASSKKGTSNNNAGGGKEKRHWVDMDAKVSAQDMAQLDQSKDKQTSLDSSGEVATSTTAAALEEARLAFLPTPEDLEQDSVGDTTNSSKQGTADQPTSWASSISGVFSQLVGSKILQDSDLKAPLQAMEDRLTTQNVSQEVARKLCATVRGALQGQRLTSMSRVQTAVQQALEASLRTILNPPHKQNVDLLRNVLANKSHATSLFSLTSSQKKLKRPYVILVMGINGIGKTTTLAKLAYYFRTNGCKPLLVAGDTFRSGAVEQLKVHADCLQIPLFSQGYSKDPSAVVKAAIQFAATDAQQNDVVLVDTAGRMQNNVPLMKALGKLVDENKPDFIIQVCEALVGHDGLSQFRMFQQAVGARGTDGLILTKYDTVGQKVGAAVTLAYETGSPVIFTGTGQKYHHLKQMSVTEVIRSLLA